MNSTKIKHAFTLIELLVGIAIVTIILLYASKTDFNRLTSKQELEIFTNNIKYNFEIIRNNSLLGKGVGNDLILPDKRKIEYSTSNSGTIINNTFYGTDRSPPLDITPTFKPSLSISKIRCLNLDLSEDEDDVEDITSGTGEIEFIGNVMTLGGDCTNNKSKILELTIKNKTDTEILLINTLNGLAEIK